MAIHTGCQRKQVQWSNVGQQRLVVSCNRPLAHHHRQRGQLVFPIDWIAAEELRTQIARCSLKASLVTCEMHLHLLDSHPWRKIVEDHEGGIQEKHPQQHPDQFFSSHKSIPGECRRLEQMIWRMLSILYSGISCNCNYCAISEATYSTFAGLVSLPILKQANLDLLATVWDVTQRSTYHIHGLQGLQASRSRK